MLYFNYSFKLMKFLTSVRLIDNDHTKMHLKSRGDYHWVTKPSFTCSRSAMETWEMCQICWKLAIKTQERRFIDTVIVSLLLTLNKFSSLFWWFHCWLLAGKCQLGMRSCLYLIQLRPIILLYGNYSNHTHRKSFDWFFYVTTKFIFKNLKFSQNNWYITNPSRTNRKPIWLLPTIKSCEIFRKTCLKNAGSTEVYPESNI